VWLVSRGVLLLRQNSGMVCKLCVLLSLSQITGVKLLFMGLVSQQFVICNIKGKKDKVTCHTNQYHHGHNDRVCLFLN